MRNSIIGISFMHMHAHLIATQNQKALVPIQTMGKQLETGVTHLSTKPKMINLSSAFSSHMKNKKEIAS